MTRSLGSLSSGSSIPREGTPQTPTMEAARGGEPEPSEFGPSNVQLALAQAHVLWARRHAPHLLEEWLR